MIVLVGVLAVAVVLSGFNELSAYMVYGPCKSACEDTMDWLSGDIELNIYNSDMLTKWPDSGNVWYISKHFSLFSKWHVREQNRSNFRVLRGSELHKAIESKHRQLTDGGNWEVADNMWIHPKTEKES